MKCSGNDVSGDLFNQRSIDSIINKHLLIQLEINWYVLMDPTADAKGIINKHISCLSRLSRAPLQTGMNQGAPEG
jgi:hypothetical protein